MSDPDGGSRSRGGFGSSTLRIVYAPALTLAGDVVRYTPETVDQIPDQWRRFAAQVADWFLAQAGPASFGVMYGSPSGIMEYACAVEVRPGVALPAGWKTMALPIARYAVFPHGGHIKTLRELELSIQCDWLPASGLVPVAGFAGGVELLERYGPRFDPRSGSGDIEVWVPIEG